METNEAGAGQEGQREGAGSRVLILAPTGRDAALASGILEREKLRTRVCSTLSDLISELSKGAGAAVITDEALGSNLVSLHAWVQTQEAWSDFPFVVLTGSKAPPRKMQERYMLMQPLGNVTLVERPLHSLTLLTVVRAALRARSRQYEVKHYIEESNRAETDRIQARAREASAQAQIELLNHVGQILSAELNLDALVPAIVDAGRDLSGADLGLFFSEGVVEGARKFALRCASNLSMAEALARIGEHAMVDCDQFFSKKIMHCSRIPGGADSEENAWLTALAVQLSLDTCIALPVLSRPGAILGVLFFGRRRKEPFSEKDERVAGSLASQAAIAIDNARLFEMAEQERKRLETARQILQRSNEELRQFAYIASHDLQEPLRTIASFTQLLVSRFGAQAGPDAAEFVHFIVDGVERMSSLIHDLLQYSSAGTPKEPPSEPTSIEGALAEVMFALSAAIRQSAAEITYDHLPPVWVEKHALITLLQNLISNAIKYTGERAPRIHVSAEAAGPNWLFSVRDNGIGIPREFHERIFGIFRRLHGREIPGTGIGLAICQRIVQWHGGTLWVESEPGMGSVFKFTLPREQPKIQQEMAEFASYGEPKRLA